MGDDTDVGAGIAEIEQTMRSDYPTYARDPRMQAKYFDLLGQREAPQARAPTAVDTELATVHERIRNDNRNYRGDKEMQARHLELIQEQKREAENPAPPAGPAQVQAQPSEPVSAELPEGHSGHGHGHSEARPIEEVITELGTEPETAALLQRWGGDAADNTAFMIRESTEILNALPLADAQELQATVDAMAPAARAALYRQLAMAGRARGTL